MNQITLTGRAVKDIELRYTSNGKPVAGGTIAVQRDFKNADGEYEADFIDFVIWGKGGEVAAEYVRKGDHFAIGGKLQTRTYENQEGRKVKVTEVNVANFDLPQKPKGQQSNQQQNNQWQGQPQQDKDPFANDGQPIDIKDDDLPF